VFADDPEDARRAFEEKRALVEETPLVTIGISPHAPYTCSLETYRWCLSLGIPVGTHLAESAAENEWLEHGTGVLEGIPILVPPTGKRAVASLAEVLGPDLLCAHCVDVLADEIELLAERGVPIAHCPRSNALLGCGIAPLAELRRAGVPVGLGTDGPSSALDLDAFAELRAAIMLQRASAGDPGALEAADALRLATLGGAEALGLEHSIGSLAPGKRADLVAVRLGDTAFWPCEDPVADLVLAGSGERVIFTMVNGIVRYRVSDDSYRAALARGRDVRRRMLALST
jgi:cytosine/adenosine deaminase-related metal-dependent hydrolase